MQKPGSGKHQALILVIAGVFMLSAVFLWLSQRSAYSPVIPEVPPALTIESSPPPSEQVAACAEIHGNWNSTGAYCYMVRSNAGMGAEFAEAMKGCWANRQGFDSWTKICYAPMLPEVNPCQAGTIWDISGAQSTGCAPLSTIECLSRGGIWNSAQEPAFCDEGAAAKVGAANPFVRFEN